MDANLPHQLLANGLLILPVFVPIVIGVVLKQLAFLPDAFWPQIERLTYYVLLPALIANAIATGKLSGLDAGPLLLSLILGLLAIIAILIGTRVALGLSGSAFGSLFHACIRPNGYMGIATALTLLGPSALAPISVLVAIWVPLGLVLATVAFLQTANDGTIKLLDLAGRLLRNPLVASVAVGIVLNAAGTAPFLIETPVLDVIGRAAVPVGLIAVGAGLTFMSFRSSQPALWAALVLGLLVMPFMMAAIGVTFGVEGAALGALVIFAAMPTSPSGYVMAGQMGGDAPLMASMISLQTLASIVTMTVVVTILL